MNWKKQWDSFSFTNGLWRDKSQNDSFPPFLRGVRGDLLFLAISKTSYLRHFKTTIFQLAVERNKINLLVYEPEQEAIVEWITH
ncbi:MULTISPECIES: element excision factor XisH family protein [Moorena]|uniref:XisH protein n=1 Tax=Moorena producens 3L TaxID=489825 RepID=F4XV67_9CYAN|nr:MULTISPECIES: element excision factor XisH family protein [Moorena]EGJ31415.1 XisH protein [Moorena producens 3L]